MLTDDSVAGPMGVKAITCHLNERRIFTRDGGRWGLAQIHAKPESEVVSMAVLPLIDLKLSGGR